MARKESAGKTCRICGRDCSDRPRMKDKKGHYFCRECFDRAKEELAARKQRAAGKPVDAAAKADAASPSQPRVSEEPSGVAHEPKAAPPSPPPPPPPPPSDDPFAD
ncbi:MAG: hypothetical protein PVI86_19000 [Phycisphaerae bacterium]